MLGLLEAHDLLLAEDLEAEVLAGRLLLAQTHLAERARACTRVDATLPKASNTCCRAVCVVRVVRVVRGDKVAYRGFGAA